MCEWSPLVAVAVASQLQRHLGLQISRKVDLEKSPVNKNVCDVVIVCLFFRELSIFTLVRVFTIIKSSSISHILKP